jgi:hypothetical protein
MSVILALDPGPDETGFVRFDGASVLESGILPNDDMLYRVQCAVGRLEAQALAIEMIASYGMPVGREVFDTCVWIGRFKQSWQLPEHVRLVFRKDVKMHLCGSPRAKDSNIRQALLDKLGPQGTKKSPGPTHGVRSHAWAALAVAVTALEVIA